MVAPSKEIIPFPMFRLPYVALKHVGDQFDMNDQMTFSVLSKRAAKFMSWSTKHIDSPTVSISSDGITINASNSGFYLTIRPSKDVNNYGYPNRFWVKGARRHDLTQLHPDFTTNQWLQHFMQLFHCKTLKLDVGPDARSLDSKWIVDATKNIPIDKMIIDVRLKEHGVEIMKQCMRPKTLYIFENPFPSRDQLNDWLCENELYRLHYTISEQQLYATVEDVRKMKNIKILEMMRQEMRCSDINKLLRMWINGWNLNLEAMLLRLYRTYRSTIERYENEMFRRVEKTTVRNQIIHPFLKENNFYKLPAVHKVYEIRRYDGVRANLAIKEKEWSMYLQFVVIS